MSTANGGHVYSIRLSRPNSDTTWGFRLAGGQDYQAPISIQSVSQNSLAEMRGLLAGDVILRIGSVEVSDHDHQQAKMEIVRSGNDLEFTIQRGGMTIWRPRTVSLPLSPQRASQPGAHRQSSTGTPASNSQFNAMDSNIPLVSHTSLAANQHSYQHVGSNFNRSPRGFPGFGYHSPADTITNTSDGRTKRVFHGQYNSPMGLYSEHGVDNAYNASLARINCTNENVPGSNFHKVAAPTSATTGPIQRPSQSNMYCGACGDIIKSIFVKVQGRVFMHPECLKCVKCGVGLRHTGYFYIEDKLYCETHARQVAQPPQPGMKPVAVYK